MQEFILYFFHILAILFFTSFLSYMQISNSTQNQYCNFTARAPQIKDAEWVSHIVNSTFPHFSTTKHQLRFISYLSKKQNFARKPKNLQDVLDRIELNQHIKKHNHTKKISIYNKPFTIK